jgi:cellulose biosynthesis protein BcsQ
VTKIYYDYLVKKFGQEMILSPLRRDTNAQKASGQHQFISSFAPEAKITEDIIKLAEEVIERTTNKQQNNNNHKTATEQVQFIGA